MNGHAKINSRKCDVCNIDVHRAFYAEHLRSKNHFVNIKQKIDNTRKVI